MIYRKFRETVFVSIILLCLSASLQAQTDYKTAAGVRLGTANGVNIKHAIGNVSTVEGILSVRWEGFILTGLYEFNQDIFDDPNMNFYYGAGAHIGAWDLDRRREPWDPKDNDIDGSSYFALGLDGIVGMEYTFTEVPFAVSLDWKPAFNLLENPGFWFDHLGLSVRFIVN